MACELRRYEKRPAAVSPKKTARNTHRIPVRVGLGNVLPATTKTALPNANSTDGHTHLLICDNRTMDKTIGMNVTAASTSRLQLSWFNTGVNRIATNKDRRSNKSGRDRSFAFNERTSTTRTRPQ